MDRFSTEYLMGVVEDLKRPPRFFLDRYFPKVETFSTEAIDFDIVDRKRRVAPLVSPLAAAKLTDQAGAGEEPHAGVHEGQAHLRRLPRVQARGGREDRRQPDARSSGSTWPSSVSWMISSTCSPAGRR
jgi:hypothetical protein